MAAAREGAHVTEVPWLYVRAWEENGPLWPCTRGSLLGADRLSPLYRPGARMPEDRRSVQCRPGSGQEICPKWSRTSVRKMLHNPVYTGTWLYKPQQMAEAEKPEDKTKHPPRPPEEWICMKRLSRHRVQRAISADPGSFPKPEPQLPRRPAENPLAGLVYCDFAAQNALPAPGEQRHRPMSPMPHLGRSLRCLWSR